MAGEEEIYMSIVITMDCFFPEEQPWFDADGNEITYGEE